jgi:hypothetical protein
VMAGLSPSVSACDPAPPPPPGTTLPYSRVQHTRARAPVDGLIFVGDRH